jgi:hypothetical protein
MLPSADRRCRLQRWLAAAPIRALCIAAQYLPQLLAYSDQMRAHVKTPGLATGLYLHLY